MVYSNQIWWNNGKVNKRSDKLPGKNFIKGRLFFKRKPHPIEHCRKISLSLKKYFKNTEAWNKGLKNPYNEITLDKMSLSAKKRVARGILPDNTGRPPWNKGLTKKTSKSVKLYSKQQEGQTRIGNYPKHKNHPNWNPNRDEFKKYRSVVSNITEKNYRLFKDQINPKNLKRVKCGKNGYQLDHKLSVYYGFNNNILPEKISSVDNLQMLSVKENRKKWHTN